MEKLSMNLYNDLICALIHDIAVCEECKKCGSDCAEARMNIIRRLVKETGNELPWTEDYEEYEEK